MKAIYIADHDTSTHVGGAEKVDENIYKALGIPTIIMGKKGEKPYLEYFDDTVTYIISNATLLDQGAKDTLISVGNYVLFEHDYKIHPTRQPHRYPNGVFPRNELINLEFYKNAKAVFLQSQDQLDCFKANGVEGNFVVLGTSIWSDAELDKLSELSKVSKVDYRFAILGNTTADKGSDIAIEFCKQNTLDYVVMENLPLNKFYVELSRYAGLVYFPRVRESFCRLVVEARCMQMNVITTRNYGAVKEPWYPNLKGRELIEFLRKSTKKNLELIKSCL